MKQIHNACTGIERDHASSQVLPAGRQAGPHPSG